MSLAKRGNTAGASRGLPIDGSIDYTAVASDDPVGQYPPLPIQTRLDRMYWLWELFTGDFSDLAPRESTQDITNQTRPTFLQYGRSRFTVQTNPFRIVPTTIAELLLMEPPEFANPRQTNNIVSALYDILVAQGVYGAAVVLATQNPDDPLEVVEPMWWVPTVSGWYIAEPMVDLDGNYSEIRVRQWVEDTGVVTSTVHQFGSTFWSAIGDIVDEEETIYAPEDPIRVIPRMPRHRGQRYRWGTSVLEDIASPVAELNQRLSDVSYALGRQARPPMTYRIADADRDEIAPDTSDTTPFDEAVDDLDAALKEYDQHEHWVLPDAIQNMEAVTWQTATSESIDMIAAMYSAIEVAASIPGLFDGLQNDGAASGVALKRMMLRLYANSLQTQKATEIAVNEVLAMSGVPPMQWQNALSVVEEASSDPEDEEGMVDES